MFKRIWSFISYIDPKLHAYLFSRFANLLKIMDWIMDRIGPCVFKTICHPAFSIILALMLVVLVATNVINLIVAVPIIAVCFITMVWISRAKWIARLHSPMKFVFLFIISLAVALGGFKFGQWSLGRYHTQNKYSSDVGLSFVHAKSIDLVIWNLSETELVRDPKYGVFLLDLNSLIEQLRQPLPIPANTGQDFIRPKECLGPTQMMGQPLVRNRVKYGDRIFGCVWVLCSNCKGTRYYWLYFKDGEGGWYAEGSPLALEEIATRIESIIENPEAYLLQVAALDKRIPIN